MYLNYFGLQREPFSIAPDPHYLFMSDRHREALAHLLYGVGSGGGFVLLTGEIGAGKTTVCRCFLEQIPEHCNVAYIFNPKLTVGELLHSVCEEFHLSLPSPAGGSQPTVKDYVDALNAFLLRSHAAGQNNVLIIDEAQNLSPDVLEQLRLLTNLETTERKLLQIILIGQPELRTMLAQPDLEQLAQRVIARYHLASLSEVETAQYIRHRLTVAGRTGASPFEKTARSRIHELARGIPRRINLLCDRALLGAYGLGRNRVDVAIVDKAAEEVFGTETAPRSEVAALPHRRLIWAGVLALGLGLAGGVWWWSQTGSRSAPARKAAAETAPTATATSTAASVGSIEKKPGNTIEKQEIASVNSSSTSADPPGGVASGGTVQAPFDGPASGASHAVAEGAKASDLAWVRDAGALDALPNLLPEAALKDLGRRWGLDLSGASDTCAQARKAQVVCYRMRTANLPMLRQLDRPGVVTLSPGGRQSVVAVMVGLGHDAVVIEMGGQQRKMPLDLFAGLWHGDFATLWRAPQGWGERLDFNRGPASVWLSEQLSRLSAEAAGAMARDAKAPLAKRVRAFQLAQGLTPDPSVGPPTFMQLNRVLGVDEPRLMQE